MLKSILWLVVILHYSLLSDAQSRNKEQMYVLLKQAVQQKDNEKAAEYSFELGKLLWEENNPEEAKKALIQSTEYSKRNPNRENLLKATFLLSNIYFETGEFSRASEYFDKSSRLAEELNNYEITHQSLLLTAESLTRIKRFKKAIEPLEKALKLSLERKALDDQLQCYELLEVSHAKAGNEKKSTEYGNLRETLLSLQRKEALARQETNALQEVAAIDKQTHERQLVAQTERLKMTEQSLKMVEEINEKRQLEINLLNKDRELANLRINEQNEKLKTEAMLRNFILAIILLGASLLGVTIVNYRKKVKTNKRIDLQNKNIKSSINYAKRIQEAMLPKKEVHQNTLQETFILFKPRDVVSGDFYWFSPLKDSTNRNDIAFAAVDCTGHGVPGAFMSMIGMNSLNAIINRGISETSSILNSLHQEIRTALQQEVSGNNDGMDVSLCIYRPGKHVLEFSGAKNSLVYIRKNELFQVKGDVHCIGGSRCKPDQRFRKHEIVIDEPTIVYLFTDGYRDQFGGDDNQKFMGKRFSKLLLEIHHLPLEEQLEALNTAFEKWKGTGEQTDDVLVMGIKLDPTVS